MAGDSNYTTDHEQIKRWVEERGGVPSCVKGTGDPKDVGVLRIDFPGYGAGPESLQHISWDEFFKKFDEKDLAMVYQEETHGGKESRFSKFVSRQDAEGKYGRH